MSALQISRRLLRQIHSQRSQAQGCKGKRKALPSKRLLRKIRAAQISAKVIQISTTDQ